MAKLTINADVKKTVINKNIYGHFSEHLGRCIYNGIFVGKDSPIPNINGVRTDVIEAFKRIKLPILRWPGGCFADDYHWMDGIGTVEKRAKIINNYWGGDCEDNSFGTHEFLDLCEIIGCEPYIAGNMGSGTVREMAQWLEYITFDGQSSMADLRRQNGREKPWNLKYFGIGNENWGCGGWMTAEYYCNEYRRYQTYCHGYGEKLFKVACGLNLEWNEVMMKNAAQFIDGLSIHHYSIPKTWEDKGSAVDFDKKEYYATLKKALHMEKIISDNDELMTKYDPQKRIGIIVDEWGTWYNVEPGTNPSYLYQQNTMRDAMVAGVNLNIFNKHSDRVVMANIAQTINVLQAIILTEGEKLILTPTYHVFDMLKSHQNSILLESSIECNEVGFDDSKFAVLNESASIDNNGNITVTVCNLSPDVACPLECVMNGFKINQIDAVILSGDMKAHNTFENPEAVMPQKFTDFTYSLNTVNLTMPPCSIICLYIK